ncbi:MAG: hypothetical protein AB7V46_18545 [Thermomicrobiales bacterium]
MTREPYRIEIMEQRHPTRTVVMIQPRRVDFAPAYFAKSDHAEQFAATLRDQHGWRILDRRGPKPCSI